MTLRPANLADLSRQLAGHHAAQRPVTSVDLAALAAVREYSPEDMTVTAEGGLTLAALQATLAARGQWLPIDPPHADRVTIRQLLSENLFGPRRCGFGTIREHLIGLEAVLADGRVTHSGGRVVKNVAGYDVLKLFVGARDSLGIITAATFKLRPLPEQEVILSAPFDSLSAAWAAITALLASPVTPVILDLHNLGPDNSAIVTVVLGFAGTCEEVEWQRAETRRLAPPLGVHPSGCPDSADTLKRGHQTLPQEAVPLGVHPSGCPGDPDTLKRGHQTLPHETAFWSAGPAHTCSILPSKLPEALAALGSTSFLARAANGIIHHRGQPPPQRAVPLALTRRLKDTFDPHNILPATPT